MDHATAAALLLIATAAAGVPLFAASCAPQAPPAGILSGAPTGWTAMLDANIRVKAAGFAPGLPPNWPPGVPRPDFQGFVRQVTPGDLSRPVPVLAMSLGIDVLAIDETLLRGSDFPDEPAPLGSGYAYYPALQLGAHGWYAILFSVDGARLGPNPTLAHAITAAGPEVDRSVFGYVLPTSTAAMLPHEGESVRVLTPEALDLRDARDGIVALNMHMALYWTDLGRYPDVFTSRPLPDQPYLLFTLDADLLTRADIDALRHEWGVSGVDGTTIFASQWNGVRWETPRVYADAADLRLDASTGVAIDGLAIDLKSNYQRREQHELLVSLRGTVGQVPAERQVLYATVVDTQPPTTPRPVVVRRRDGGYGSLGRELRGGEGIGDFCTADPWVVGDLRASVFDADALLDDFFVARRLPPSDAYASMSVTGSGLQLGGFVPASASAPLPFGATVDTGSTSPGALDRPLALVPAVNLRLRLPELGLAIAGFRYHDGARAKMRACMSGPVPNGTAGEATVRWGLVADYARPTHDPANVTWVGSIDLPYAGVAFSYDVDLPDDGVLPPRRLIAARRPSGIPGGVASIPDTHNRVAVVMQWKLRTSERTWVSPIAALRY